MVYAMHAIIRSAYDGTGLLSEILIIPSEVQVEL